MSVSQAAGRELTQEEKLQLRKEKKQQKNEKEVARDGESASVASDCLNGYHCGWIFLKTGSFQKA